MKAIRVLTPSQFESTIQSVMASTPGRVFVLFFGNENPETHQSWCPDCVIADPKIRKALLQAQDKDSLTLIECLVGERAVWRSPDNYYRTHPLIKLSAIPTLCKWSKAGPQGKLVEDDC
ncbi:hypothetical protein BKA69DRAFT_1012695, partial [Paraphysoderma sedebokerense]